jgi:hypothetical protein
MKTTRDRELERKAYQIVKEMPVDERVAVAFGFYDMDGVYADAFDGFNNFEDGDTSPDATTSVNGAFGTNGMYDGLDNFQDGFINDFDGDDDDFDNLLSKKSRKRRKKRRQKRKEYKKQGLSRKEARKKARKEAEAEVPNKLKRKLKKVSIKNVGKGLKKIGQKIGKGLKAVGNVIKKGALFVPRQAARGLIALNFRGVASKIQAVKDNPANKSYKSKLESKWKKLGGKVSKLYTAAKSGAKKKPLLCGAKCKQNLAKATSTKKGFLGADGVVNYGRYQLDPRALKSELRAALGEFNVEPATATLIAAGSGIVGTVIATISGAKQRKQDQKQFEDTLKQQKINDDREYELMAEQQNITKEEAKKQLDLIEKQVTDELNPINQVLNNPDLSQEEKNEAVKQIESALETKAARKKSNILLYAGIGLIALLGIGFILKKK